MKSRLCGALGASSLILLATAAPALAFPTYTNVGDSFTRSGTSSLGPNWSSSLIPGATGTVALGNQRLQFPATGWSSAHWSAAQFGGLQEASVVKSSAGQVGVTACLRNPGPSASGYALTTETNGSLTLKKYTNGAVTTLFSNDATGGTVATGNAVGIAVTSTGVQAWIGNGTWTLAKQVTDAAAASCTGYIGVIGFGASGDIFGGGGQPLGATPTPAPPTPTPTPAPPTPGPVATVPAQPASTFVSSIGVNTHFRLGTDAYIQSPYCSQAGFDLALSRLAELGVDDVREEIQAYPAAGGCNLLSRYDALVDAGFGINLVAHILPNKNVSTATALTTFGTAATSATNDDILDVAQRIHTRPKPANKPGVGLTAIEGTNEYDVKDPTTLFGTTFSYPWLAKYSSLVPAFRNASKARLPQVPVVLASLAKGGAFNNQGYSSYLRYANDTSNAKLFDVNNMHFYSSRYAPDERIQKWLDESALIGPNKPLISTETGWNDGANALSVSRLAAATYTARGLLLNASKGVSKTYLYELADMGTNNSDTQHRWGLLDQNLTPKPSFYALKRMLAAIGDGETDADAGASYTPAPLGLGVGGTNPIAKYVLGKQNGSYIVALWRPEAMTAQNGTDVAVPAVSVPLTFGQSYTASTFRPAEPDPAVPGTVKTTAYSPTTSWTGATTGTTKTVSVGADPVLVKLVP